MTHVYLIKRSKGGARYYALKWKRSDGKWQQESIGKVGAMTANEAKAARDAKLTAIGGGTELRDKPRAMTLAALLAADGESIKATRSTATVRSSRLAGDSLLGAVGDMDARKLTVQHVDRLVNWLSAPHEINGRKMPACGKATIRRTVITLKAVWNRARKRGRLAGNPFASVELPKVQPKQKRIFTPAEVEAMIEAAPDAWWKAMIRFGFTTGLRLGELLALTWGDVDEAAGTVTVSAKRRADDRLEWSAKSHGERTVPFDAKAAALLPRLRLAGGGSAHPFIPAKRLTHLLTLQASGKLPEPSQWMGEIRAFDSIQRTALGPAAALGTFHDLRKSFGTHAANAGVPMHELCRLMGHSTITVTATFYTATGGDVREKLFRAFAMAG